MSGPVFYGNPYGVTVSPQATTASQLPSNGTSYTASFTVQNVGNGTAISVASIAGTGVTHGANPDSARLANIDVGASASVTVTYSVASVAAGTIDTLFFTARSR